MSPTKAGLSVLEESEFKAGKFGVIRSLLRVQERGVQVGRRAAEGAGPQPAEGAGAGGEWPVCVFRGSGSGVEGGLVWVVGEGMPWVLASYPQPEDSWG